MVHTMRILFADRDFEYRTPHGSHPGDLVNPLNIAKVLGLSVRSPSTDRNRARCRPGNQYPVIGRRSDCTSYPVDAHRAIEIGCCHEAQSLCGISCADPSWLSGGVRHVLECTRIATSRPLAGSAAVAAAIAGGIYRTRLAGGQ